MTARFTPSVIRLLESGTQQVVIDGIYSPAEFEYLRSHVDEQITRATNLTIDSPSARRTRMQYLDSQPLEARARLDRFLADVRSSR